MVRRLALWCLVASAAALILGAGVVAFAHLFPQTFAPAFVSGIAKATGLSVTVEDFTLSPLSFLNFRLSGRNLVLADKNTGLTAAQADGLALSLDLSGALKKRVAIRDLYLDAPRANLAMDSGGALRMGGIALAGGKGSAWKVAMERMVVEKGTVGLVFPPELSLPPLTLDEISAGLALPLMGTGLDLSARLIWAGEQGKVRISGAGLGEDYRVSFALADIPLNGFTIPGDPKAFADIPVSGSLSLSGTAWRKQGEISGKLSFSFADLCLHNRNAPDGEIFAHPFSGDATFSHRAETGLTASGNLSELALAFSRFSGRFSLSDAPGRPFSYAVSLAGTDFSYKELRPYLTSFLQPQTGKWLTERVANAELSNLRVLLRGPLAPSDPPGGGPVFLRAATEVKGASLWPSPESEPITGLSGKLAFFTEHMTGSGLTGQAPGAGIEDGELSIVYGGLPGTPMEITARGRAETGEIWPWVQGLIHPKGFLSRMGLSGPADVTFAWSTDLDGGKEDEFTAGVKAQGMTIAFEKGGKQPLTLTRVKGDCQVTQAAVSFSDLSVGLADASAQATGVFATDDAGATRLLVRARGLTAVLPTYADPLHPMRAWFPRELGAEAELLKEPGADSPLRVPFVLGDEDKKSLKGEFAFYNGGWSLSDVSGGVGALSLSGNLASGGDCKLSASVRSPSLSAILHRGGLLVQDGKGSLDIAAGQVRAKEWELWRIPDACRELFSWTHASIGSPGAGSLPFRSLSLTAKAAFLDLGESLAGPFSLEGELGLAPGFSLEARKATFGPRTLSFSFQHGPKGDRLRAEGRRGRLSEYAALGRWGASLASGPADGPGGRFSASVVLANVTAPGLEAASYTADVRYAPAPGGWALSASAGLDGSDLSLSARKSGQGLAVNAASRRMELFRLAAVAREMKDPDASGPAAEWSAELFAAVDDLILTPDLSGPFSARAALSQVKQGLVADIPSFSLLGKTGRASLSLSGNRGALSLNLDEFFLPEAVGQAKALAGGAGLGRALGPSQDGLSVLDFRVEAPRVRGADDRVVALDASGNAVFSTARVSLEASRFSLGRQEGMFSIFSSDNDLRLRADFSYLDLRAIDELMTGKPEPEPEPEEKEEESPKGKKVALAWEPPRRSIEISLAADTLKVWRTSFESLRFEGSASPERIGVSDLSWQKDGKEVFSLDGEMDRQPDGQWTYAAQSQFQDLGDVTKLLVSRKYKAKEHFPIQGGETHARVTGIMKKDEEGLWIPRGKIVFDSKEGTIDVGGRFLMVLAALSPQNYIRAIAGERTELSGKGAVFKNMKGVLDYDGDLVTVSEFFFESPSLRYVADGTVDLAAYTENLHICMQPFESLNKIISYTPGLSWILLNRDGAIFETCFRAEGDISDPKVYALPQSMVPTRLQDLFDGK